ncbi:MAG: FliH/SctL family protein [Vicinamibacterales bacterium]|nr:FliH/SctL family protein [Vicinamibacterales bacterium]
MSSRARRVSRVAAVTSFAWSDVSPHSFETEVTDLFGAPPAAAPEAPPEPRNEPADDRTRIAALERDAFATAYAQGEKAGMEAGTTRADAMLRRLSDTLLELEELRRSMIRQTEHQIVQLAVEMARRILRREVQTDSDLLCAMARVALDRLGDTTPATIRLNPEDYHTIIARHGGTWAGNHVTVVADPAVGRGGCMVESTFGFIDASVEAQFRVLEQALLADDGAAMPAVSHAGA